MSTITQSNDLQICDTENSTILHFVSKWFKFKDLRFLKVGQLKNKNTSYYGGGEWSRGEVLAYAVLNKHWCGDKKQVPFLNYYLLNLRSTRGY